MSKNAVAVLEKETTIAVPSKQGYSAEQVQLVKNTVAKNHTDDELALFFGQCERTGLDPFCRQIYSIKRGNQATVQVSIDGFRLIAHRTGQMNGYDDTVWFDKDGGEHIKWLSNEPPAGAMVTVYKKGCEHPFSAFARFNSYASYNDRGQPMGLWSKMPDVMIAKCAEALALRKAFPQELSGLYSMDEMEQAGSNPVVEAVEVSEPAKKSVTTVASSSSKQTKTKSGTSTVKTAEESSKTAQAEEVVEVSAEEIEAVEPAGAFDEPVENPKQEAFDARMKELNLFIEDLTASEKLEPSKPNAEIKSAFLAFCQTMGYGKEAMNKVLLDNKLGFNLDAEAIRTNKAFGKMREAAKYFALNPIEG